MKKSRPDSPILPLRKIRTLRYKRTKVIKLEIEKKVNLLTKSKIFFLFNFKAKIPEKIDQPVTNKVRKRVYPKLLSNPVVEANSARNI